jgi:hypothetical protein
MMLAFSLILTADELQEFVDGAGGTSAFALLVIRH